MANNLPNVMICPLCMRKLPLGYTVCLDCAYRSPATIDLPTREFDPLLKRRLIAVATWGLIALVGILMLPSLLITNLTETGQLSEWVAFPLVGVYWAIIFLGPTYSILWLNGFEIWPWTRKPSS